MAESSKVIGGSKVTRDQLHPSPCVGIKISFMF